MPQDRSSGAQLTRWNEGLERIDPKVVAKYNAANPDKFRKTAEQKLFDIAVVAASMAHTRGLEVNPDNVKAQNPLLKREQLESLMATPKFYEAMEARGIPAGGVNTGMTAEQLYAIQVMVDPTGNLTPWAKLKRLGISWAKWEGWLKQPLFARYYSELSEKIMAESVPNALTRLNQLADAGDMKAITLLLQLTGRIKPEQAQVTDFKRLVDVLLEAVQSNVSNDQEYAAVVRAVFAGTGQAGLDLPELEAEVIPDDQET